MIERVASQIRAGQAKSEIRADLDPTTEAIAITGTMPGIMSQWLIAPDAINLDAVRDAYVASLRRSWAG